MSADPRPAAAWYPDPAESGQLRWWDGQVWTEHISPLAGSDAAAQHALDLVGVVSDWRLLPDRSDSYVEPVAGAAVADAVRVSTWVVAAAVALVVLALLFTKLLLALVLVGCGCLALSAWRSRAETARQWAAWHRERGLEVAPPPVVAALLAETLRAGGVTGTVDVTRAASGRLWPAARDAFLAACTIHPGSKDPSSFLIAMIDLPAPVAERYRQLRVQVRAPGAILTTTGFPSDARWRELAFEQSTLLSGIQVEVGEQQDQVAVWELFHPAFITRLTQVAAGGLCPRFGILVADGRLLAWHRKDLPEQTVAARVGLSGRGGSEDAARASDARLVAWLGVVRDMHRRLLEEWR